AVDDRDPGPSGRNDRVSSTSTARAEDPRTDVQPRQSLPTPMAKRAFDIARAGTGLLLSSPIWLALAAAVRLEDGGSVFYSQDRSGKDGRVFRAWKFRSMVPDAEKHVG